MRRFEVFIMDWDSWTIQAENEQEARQKTLEQWKEIIEQRKDQAKTDSYWKEVIQSNPMPEMPNIEEIIEIGQEENQFGPSPKCCDKIQETREYHFYEGPVIRLSVMDYDREENKVVTRIRWKIISKDLEIEVNYCPFCGTKLPKVREKEIKPEPLWTPNDGYCGTCNRRNGRGCRCNPPEAAYEVI